MGLFDELMADFENVDNVGTRSSTTSTFCQHTGKKQDNNNSNSKKYIFLPEERKKSGPVTNRNNLKHRLKEINVDNVACVRPRESQPIRTFSSISYKDLQSPVYGYTRASDNIDISVGDCESCPAAGYWDYYGPGKWCFHAAYFLGKTATPVKCSIAVESCPLGDRQKDANTANAGGQRS